MDSYEGNSNEPASIHKYVYAHVNPVNGIDPSGHEFNLIGLQIAASIGIAVHQTYDETVLNLGFVAQQKFLETLQDREEEDYFTWDEEWEDFCTVIRDLRDLPPGVIVNFNGTEVVLRDPAGLYYSQDNIKAEFQEAQYGTVHDLAERLKSGKTKPADVKPIRLVNRQGRLISIDNRRLYAFKKAKVTVPTRMATVTEIVHAESLKRFSAGRLGSLTIRIRARR